MSFTSYSIVKEDILLLRALKDVPHEVGFYIDVGANDPEEHSVTKLFYDHGWRGINIEPSSYWFRRLSESRPRDVNIHAAASDVAGRVTLYDDLDGGLGTLVEKFADRHVVDFNRPKRAVEVDAVTLTSICEKHAPDEIHFLKIDVEGHEEQVIRGMDFGRYRPWILCVEATEPLRPSAFTHDAWEPLLGKAGYRFALFDSLNRWYIAEEHSDLAAKFSAPVDDYIHYPQVRRIRELEQRVEELQSARIDQADQIRSARAFDLLRARIESPLNLIDVGAAGGALEYWKNFRDKARIYCFEAREDDASELSEGNTDQFIEYVPLALSKDNKGIDLHVTHNPGCSSVYRPIRNLYERYPGCSIMRPVRGVSCASTTIDEFIGKRGIDSVHAIKLDTQGSELDVLRGAEQALRTCALLIVETEFNPLYEGQALFCDIDRFLRDRGFVLWRLGNLAHYSTAHLGTVNHPMLIGAEPGGNAWRTVPNGQLFWADAFYVRQSHTPVSGTPISKAEAITAAALAGQLNFWDLAIDMVRQSGDHALAEELASALDLPFVSASPAHIPPSEFRTPEGHVTSSSIEAGFGGSHPCLIFGPYLRLAWGVHEVTFHVDAEDLGDQPLKGPLVFDVAQDMAWINSIELIGPEGARRLRSGKITIRFFNGSPNARHEFRIFAPGPDRPFEGKLVFSGVSLTHIRPEDASR